MRQRRPVWLLIIVLAVSVLPARQAAIAYGTPGGESDGELLMNEFPVLPPEARKKFELTSQDPAAAVGLLVTDFFQLVADILNLNIVIADREGLAARTVGIVMRDMSIEEAVRLVLQMNRLKAVHFNENTIIVMDRDSASSFGTQEARPYRLRYVTIEKVREYVQLNPNIQRVLGQGISYDTSSNRIIALGTPQQHEMLGMMLEQLDRPPIKAVEAIKLSHINLQEFSALVNGIGVEMTDRLKAVGISYNPQGRRLLVYGTPEDHDLVRRLVRKFDVAPKQVLIDTELLQVSSTFQREFGFKFQNSNFTVNQFDRIFDINRVRDQLAGDDTGAGQVFPTRTQINYLISKTGARTLQSPKVRAVDGAAATINIGEIRNVQIQSTATTLGTGLTPGQQQTTFNTQEVPIGVQMNVQPQIHNDDTVTLDIRISVTSVLEIKAFGVDRTTQDSTTRLRIRNGETVVLGGFINQRFDTDDTPIPIIGEIPILEKIFRNKKRDRQDSELVFLLTPYILDYDTQTPNPDECPDCPPKAKVVEVTSTVYGEAGPSAADARSMRKGAKSAAIDPGLGGAEIPVARTPAESASDGLADSARTERVGPARAELANPVRAELVEAQDEGAEIPILKEPLDESAPLPEIGKPVKLESTTTRVIEHEKGATRLVYGPDGKLVKKELLPKIEKAGGGNDRETRAAPNPSVAPFLDELAAEDAGDSAESGAGPSETISEADLFAFRGLVDLARQAPEPPRPHTARHAPAMRPRMAATHARVAPAGFVPAERETRRPSAVRPPGASPSRHASSQVISRQAKDGASREFAAPAPIVSRHQVQEGAPAPTRSSTRDRREPARSQADRRDMASNPVDGAPLRSGALPRGESDAGPTPRTARGRELMAQIEKRRHLRDELASRVRKPATRRHPSLSGALPPPGSRLQTPASTLQPTVSSRQPRTSALLPPASTLQPPPSSLQSPASAVMPLWPVPPGPALGAGMPRMAGTRPQATRIEPGLASKAILPAAPGEAATVLTAPDAATRARGQQREGAPDASFSSAAPAARRSGPAAPRTATAFAAPAGPQDSRARDRALLERLRSLSQPTAASPLEAGLVVPGAPTAATIEDGAGSGDRAGSTDPRGDQLRARLQALNLPAPSPAPAARVVPQDSSFEDLARKLEQQLGAGQS